MVLLERDSWYAAKSVLTMVLLPQSSTVEMDGGPPYMAKILRAICPPAISREKHMLFPECFNFHKSELIFFYLLNINK